MSEQIDDIAAAASENVSKVQLNQIPHARRIDNHQKCGGGNDHWWLQQVHNVVVDYKWIELFIEFKQFGAMHIFEKFQV